MPSWNVHIAHVEKLLAQEKLCRDVVRNRDAFVMGNLVPDIYVGYMVPNITRKIPYRDTHFANPDFVPAPDASRFYTLYIHERQANDLTVGAWCHLLCDHYYNLRTIEYLARIGVPQCDETRQRKQADYNLYGRTLNISLVPHVDASVLGQCASFEQYELFERDIHAAAQVANDIVSKNQDLGISGTPAYDLLTAEFFDKTSHEVDEALSEALTCLAHGRDASHLGRPPA